MAIFAYRNGDKAAGSSEYADFYITPGAEGTPKLHGRYYFHFPAL